ncbi:alpha/beta hydrolase family protein [Nocardioides sp. GXQ0305]|uniref:alpha/beta hydrolase family protein n=1 Tax=Nocardioides sp. GXQ0305 TaxID=3423912 RepID=UPI003D7E05D7
MTDARVAAAIEHWAPRFVQNGVDHNDFVATTARVATWEDWLPEWSRTAERHEREAQECESRERTLSAGHAWLRAAVCHHFGKFVWMVDRDLSAEAGERSVAALRRAHAHLDPTAERVTVPLEGARVVGNLRRPPGVDRPPLVVLVPGLDSTKEEFFWLEQSFLDRGMATVSLDGPGQGETAALLPARHDYEVAVTAVLDLLEGREDLDLSRTGLYGVSLGGYYAPRVTAHEPRVRAMVAMAGPYRWGDLWDSLPPMTRETWTVKSHAGSSAEARDRAAALDLTDVCEQIAVPTLYVTGKLDRLVPWEQTRQQAESTPGAELIAYDDGNHGCSNLSVSVRPMMADWMSEHLTPR